MQKQPRLHFSFKFTLIELLVSLSIFMVLASLLQPSLKKVFEVANSTHCQSNLRQLMVGVHLYSDDNDDVLIPFAAPAGEGLYYSLKNWTGMLTTQVFNPDYKKPKFDSVEDFKMASCPSSDKRFGYGHNYNFIGAQHYPKNWVIIAKRSQGTRPSHTTVLVDNTLTYDNKQGLNQWSNWRSFVRPGGWTLQDNSVYFVHSELTANVGWLDGSVSARYIDDGYLNPGNPQTTLDWWALVK